MKTEKQEKLDEFEAKIARVKEAIDVLQDVRNELWKKRDALFCDGK
jgi:acyl-CoA synthetase (NDP forming)